MVFVSEDVLNRLKDLSCEDVAEKLKMNVRIHRTLCFMHVDSHPSLAFLGKDRKRWYCFVCKKGGNAIDLVREKLNCGFVEACSWLCAQYGISLNENSPRYSYRKLNIGSGVKKKDVEKLFAKEVAQFIIDNCRLSEAANRFLFEERRLSHDVIKKLKLVSIDTPWEIISKLKDKFDEETLRNSGLVSVTNGKFYLRLFTPCLLFPYFNLREELIGLQSRYLGENKDAPRFQFLSSQKTHLFNLPILQAMHSDEELYISEGITDCLALLSSGKKAVAIPSATILPEKDLIKLSKFKLRMYPDRDEAGERAFASLQTFFIKQMSFLKPVRLPDKYKDYSDYYKDQYGR